MALNQLGEKAVFLHKTFSASEKSSVDPSQLPADAKSDSPKKSEKPTDRATILIVEDEPAIRLIQSERLKMMNCHCTTAANGEQALMLYTTADLILLDINLPDATGFEVCRYIRQQPEGKTLPIVAHTGLFSKATEEKCYAVGMDSFLTKPASLFDLYRVLYDHLPEYRLVIQRVESDHDY